MEIQLARFVRFFTDDETMAPEDTIPQSGDGENNDLNDGSDDNANISSTEGSQS